MSEMKHSAEPWIVGSNATLGDGRAIYCKELEVWQNAVARCPVMQTGDFDSDLDETDANAHRIVACVNACAGIADPAGLRSQRDDLLAACRLLVENVQEYEAWQRPCHAVDVARAAIARAEGGAEKGA